MACSNSCCKFSGTAHTHIQYCIQDTHPQNIQIWSHILTFSLDRHQHSPHRHTHSHTSVHCRLVLHCVFSVVAAIVATLFLFVGNILCFYDNSTLMFSTYTNNSEPLFAHPKRPRSYTEKIIYSELMEDALINYVLNSKTNENFSSDSVQYVGLATKLLTFAKQCI